MTPNATPASPAPKSEQESVIREAMNHYYARDAQSLEQLIRRLIHKSQQP
jgi:hypothetical protein